MSLRFQEGGVPATDPIFFKKLIKFVLTLEYCSDKDFSVAISVFCPG